MKKIVQEAWSSRLSTRSRISLNAKITNTSGALQRWNKEHLGFCSSRIKDLEDSLVYYSSLQPSEEHIRSMQKIQAELDEWRLRLELVWRQK